MLLFIAYSQSCSNWTKFKYLLNGTISVLYDFGTRMHIGSW